MTDEKKGRTPILYVVGDKDSRLANERLVDATSKAQALKLEAEAKFYAHPASAQDVRRIMKEQQTGEGGGA